MLLLSFASLLVIYRKKMITEPMRLIHFWERAPILKNTIRILHLSDLHFCLSNKDVLSRRLNALFKRLDKQKGNVDFLIFTGDLTQSGKVVEFEEANRLFIEPLKSRLNLSKNKIYLAPGNHDINRELIDMTKETLLLASIGDTKVAEQHFIKLDQRLTNYNTYISQNFKNSKTIIEMQGLKVGIYAINTAWRCSGKTDKGNLFITEKQLDTIPDAADCAIKIAIMHHPLDWLHNTEQDSVVNDLKRNFDLIFTGHLHVPKAIGEISPKCSSSLVLSAPSIYNTDGRPLGYNIYEIDYENRKFNTIFYKYIRSRDDFDRDTDQAEGGEYKFDLPLKNNIHYDKHVICQRVSSSNSEMKNQIVNQLKLYQHLEYPILVSQKLANVTIDNGRKSNRLYSDEHLNICVNNCVIYAPKDMGKTIFIESLLSKISERSFQETSTVGLYLDIEGKPVSAEDMILKISDMLAKLNLTIDSGNIVVGVDHIQQNDYTQFHIINELTTRHPNIKAVTAVSNSIIFETLTKQPGLENWSLYEILHWGPSTIREYIEKYVEAQHRDDIDVDAAFNFITTSLKDSDLPSNPVNVTLYLSVIPIIDSKFSSLSFLHLLEKIEYMKLQSIGGAPQNAFYNKREVLSYLAALCLNNSDIRVDTKRGLEFVQAHFKKMALDVDASNFMKELSTSGIIDMDYNYISFRHYVFFDYFLARAYEQGILCLDKNLALDECIRLGKSLALFCGMKRSYDHVVYMIADHLDPHFDAITNFTLNDLDKYIHDLLEPIDSNVSDDEIAERDINTKLDYELLDQNYHAEKEQYAASRKEQAKIKQIKDELDRIVLKVSGLQVLYNCYRNLENMTADHKLLILNQILEFHICCTLDMIKYFCKHIDNKDYHTIIAYFATMSGQEFLTDNIANQSLELTFNQYYESFDNDFKQLLIICLMADLKLDNYPEKLRCFAEKTTSRAAIEIIYFKLRDLIIKTESKKVPTSLISAFKSVFNRRFKIYHSKDKKEVIDRYFNTELERAKTEHLRAYNDNQTT